MLDLVRGIHINTMYANSGKMIVHIGKEIILKNLKEEIKRKSDKIKEAESVVEVI